MQRGARPLPRIRLSCGVPGCPELFSSEGAGAPRPVTGSRPRKPIISRNYHKPQLHLIHPACRTPQLSLAHLRCAGDSPTGPQPGGSLEPLPLSHGDTGGCFVDTAGCDNTKHDIQKTLATQHTAQPRRLPPMIARPTGSPAPPSAQHHGRVAHPPLTTSPNKIEIQISKCSFYWTRVALAPPG